MLRALILVEGQTEEVFVKDLLQSYLSRLGVAATATIVKTKRVASGPDYKGGVGAWAKIERDLRLLLRDTNVAAVTTMIDYYGVPAVPGSEIEVKPADPHQAVHFAEGKMNDRIGDDRFHAHLMLHEFESLLYSSPSRCADYLGKPALATAMETALRECGAPELVDDHPTTAPSKRIIAAYPEYAKALDGPVLAAELGIDAMRAACPHFNEWLEWFESLAASAA